IAELKTENKEAKKERDVYRKQVEELDRKVWESNEKANLFADKVFYFLTHQSDDRKAREDLVREISLSRRKSDATRVPGTRERILLVDDNQDTCRMMATTLAQSGYETSEAYNGGDALQQWASAKDLKNPFGAIILDYSMP